MQISIILTTFLLIGKFHSLQSSMLLPMLKPLFHSRPCVHNPYRGIIGTGGHGGGFAGRFASGYRQNPFNMNDFRRRKLFHHEIDFDQHHGTPINMFGAVGFGKDLGKVRGRYDQDGEFGEWIIDHDHDDHYD
ncbi:hypothetical protein BLA29_004105 [Euroglyphus maynei]|uniref:Uncharacterized protein n=1 Tax=Euroglyphus maynei TaxID=6958 RepID=A0A1Y3B0G9_EURMA|nr:hypothetical protein BLA29_004105 [Euroglyphus maynei]